MLTPTERVKIGSWTDATGKLNKTKKLLQMPDRHSDKYLMTQAKAKTKTIIAARVAWTKKKIKDHGLSESMTWEMYFLTCRARVSLVRPQLLYFREEWCHFVSQ